MDTFGFPTKMWNTAKAEARAALVARAPLRGMMPYSELVQDIRAIAFEPRDVKLFRLLGELSTVEARVGRGMITALVVPRHGDMQPGPGFFELAEELGRDTTDILACWIGEVKKVHATWERSGE